MARAKKYSVYVCTGYNIEKVADFYAEGDSYHYCKLMNKEMKDSSFVYSTNLEYLQGIQKKL